MDNQGNFYVVTNTVGSAAPGIYGASLLAVIDPNITTFLGTFTENRVAVSARDVTVDNGRQFAYVSLEDGEDGIVRYPLAGVMP